MTSDLLIYEQPLQYYLVGRIWAWIKTQQDSATVTENVHSLKGDRCQLWREDSGCRAILEHWLADLWRFPGVSLRAGCAALFLGRSQVQRKEQVRGSPSLSDPTPPQHLREDQWGSCLNSSPFVGTLSVSTLISNLLEHCSLLNHLPRMTVIFKIK